MWLVGGSLLLGWGCATGDKESPTLSVDRLTPAPVSDSVCGVWEADRVIRLVSGDTLRMRLFFSDNDGLAQYKIGIHSNFDCHGHRNLSEAWLVSEIGNLDGLSDTVERALAVPADAAAGTYHFELLALDAAGNELENYPIYTLLVTNAADTVAPSAVLSEPAVPATAARGSTLVFAGTAFDNFALDFGRAEVRCRLPNGDSQTLGTWAFSAGTGVQGSFSIPCSIPANWSAGTYPFFLWVWDGYNNSVNQRIAVQIN
jgi:hypothetical protein